ncbi:MAG TPA: hypothetical protein VE359_08320 [Vicinamibacteria bacterium]|nr:hypothetical protein [Vicinamibacteria bacterium]
MAALILFVSVLGLLPHVRFGLLIGEVAFFESAYDEPTYALWTLAGGGPVLPHRWLSQAALRALFSLANRSWDWTLILADVALPALCAVLAWMLSCRLTRLRLFRLVAAMGMLFAQEFFSLGCWTIWRFQEFVDKTPLSGSAPLDWRSVRSSTPPWLLALVPDYGSPYLGLFRTPEPQVSQALFLMVLILLLDLSKAQADERRHRHTLVAIGVLLNAVLAFAHFFQATALVLLEALLGLTLVALGQRRPARAAGGLALVGAVSVLLGTLAYHGHGAARGWSFRSHLPVVTPASIVAAVGLVLVATLLWRSLGDTLLPVAAACFGTILVVTNQQVLSGWMISTRDWERAANYPLVFLGSIAIGAGWLRRSRMHLTTLYALAGGGLLAGCLLLVTAQDRVFEEYLVKNLKSVALKRAVEAAEVRAHPEALLVLQDPELAFLLQARLNRPANILVDGANVFVRQVDPLEKAGGEWGRRSRFKRELFEYLARMGRTPARFARTLQEGVETGSGESLFFLFDLKDWWPPYTDGRRTRPEEIRAHLPEISQDYERYLEAGDPCWAQPAIVLTRQSPAERGTGRWNETFLVEATVGTESPIMNAHALLQTSTSPLAGAGASRPCDR